MNDSKPQFDFGNCHEYGSSSRQAPDPESVAEIVSQLGRKTTELSDDGFQCDIISAVTDSESGAIAYVESRAVTDGDFVDISIKIHVIRTCGKHDSCDIESYNPYFGCDVSFFRWIHDAALLIYREKHRTYVVRLGADWPPQFIEIEDRWLIVDETLAYIGYKQKFVRRLTFPHLVRLEPISVADAERQGCLPSESYAG